MATAALMCALVVTALIAALCASLLYGRAGRGKIAGAHRNALTVIFLARAVVARASIVFLVHSFSVLIGLFFQ